jgi:hypothetical protein
MDLLQDGAARDEEQCQGKDNKIAARDARAEFLDIEGLSFRTPTKLLCSGTHLNALRC